MAGLFGNLFNYEKEGPGIEKDAPPKKTIVVFFETFFRNFWKLMPVNIIYWLLFWLPFGFSAVGITNVTRNLSRDKHSFGLSDFFETIKKNIGQCFSVGLINTVFLALIVFDFKFFLDYEGVLADIGLGVCIMLFAVFFMMRLFIWFMVITFKLKLKQIYLNAFKFAIINLKNNLIIGVTLIVYWVLCYCMVMYIPGAYGIPIVALLTLLVYPGFRYLLVQFGVFGMIKKCMIDPYYEAHPEEDIENRRNLGLDVGDKYSEEDLY